MLHQEGVRLFRSFSRSHVYHKRKPQRQDFRMKSLIFLGLLVVCLHGNSARLHSLKYFYTASTEVPNFPEFVAVGLVDDVQMFRYDSNTRRALPKQDWMDKYTADDPQYLNFQTQIALGSQRWFKVTIGILKQHFNQTEGLHIGQRIYGCEWDDETGDVSVLFQYSYNGEDLVVFDRKTEMWITSKPQAVRICRGMNDDKVFKGWIKFYLNQDCPEWLKKFLDYGNSTLMRTDLPSVSLLQKTSSSPVRCFATGFYPKTASLVWRRDGVEIHEDVEHGEILPNQDGTFQMSVDLDVSSVKAEDWGRLDCVFQLSGVKEDMVTRLDRAVIKTNEENPNSVGIIVAVVAALVLLAIAVIGFLIHRKKNIKRPPSPVTDSEVEVEDATEEPLNKPPELETT